MCNICYLLCPVKGVAEMAVVVVWGPAGVQLALEGFGVDASPALLPMLMFL